MKTFTPKPADLTHDWYVIDATDVVLGRLATQAATLLRGNNKPTYAPHADSGNHVIILNADKIALTKLDVLSSLKEIPVITGYKLDGVEVPAFDPLSDLDRVKPVVTLLPGWNKDISGCKSWDELPKEAKAYAEFLEKQLGHEIQFVSTGAEREKFVLKGEWL